jgi:CBS domain-containing protein
VDDPSARFLTAFNAVDQWLRGQTTTAERLDFPELVDAAAERNAGVRRRRQVLKELNRLRNLIVHHYNRSRPFVIPAVHAIEQMLAVENELLSPPALESVAAKPVELCRPDDALGPSVQKMRAGRFSQLPVYDGPQCLGLLTADTIARWLAKALEDGVGLVEERPVSEILTHQEHDQNYTFVPRAATVADGLTAFDDFLRRGLRLDAVLITHGGQATEAPVGIVTIHDIPALRRAVRE